MLSHGLIANLRLKYSLFISSSEAQIIKKKIVFYVLNAVIKDPRLLKLSPYLYIKRALMEPRSKVKNI